MKDEQSSPPASLKNKLKQTLCLSNNNNHDDCLRLPEIRNKCRDLINCIGFRRRRCSTADFKYDLLSYSLNFDQGGFNDDYHYERIDEAGSTTQFPPPGFRGNRLRRWQSQELLASRADGKNRLLHQNEIE